MKKLELNQMEGLEGGGKPSAQQVTCFVISSVSGLVCPPLGIAQGFLCLFMD